MPYKVIVDHPSAGETSLYIHGLGTFKNHTETEVSDDQIRRYRAAHSVVNVSSPNKKSQVALQPVQGKDPIDQKIFGVTIEKVGE